MIMIIMIIGSNPQRIRHVCGITPREV